MVAASTYFKQDFRVSLALFVVVLYSIPDKESLVLATKPGRKTRATNDRQLQINSSQPMLVHNEKYNALENSILFVGASSRSSLTTLLCPSALTNGKISPKSR